MLRANDQPDLSEQIRSAHVLFQQALVRLQTLEAPAAQRSAAGQALSSALRALYDAMAPTAQDAARFDAVSDALRHLGSSHAALEPLAPAEARVVVDEIERARALLVTVQQRLQEIAHANFQNRKPIRGGRPESGNIAGVSYGWSRSKLVLHHLERRAVAPAFTVAEDEGAPLEADLDDDAPGFTLEQLQAMAAALESDQPLDQDDPAEAATTPATEPADGPPAAVPDAPLPAELVASHLEQLATLYQMRAFQQADPGTAWTEIAATEQRIFERADALVWLGAEVIAPLLAALNESADAAAAFAATLPLVVTSGLDTIDAVFRGLETMPPPTLPGMVDALRLSPHPEVSGRAPLLLRLEVRAELRALAVPLAAERDLLQDYALTALLRDVAPAVNAAAARATLRGGKVHLVSQLEALAEGESADPAAVEALTAAAVLGSSAALNRARARLAGAADPPARLLELIAACGDEGDLPRLIELGSSGGEHAFGAIRAMGWLGSSAAVDTLTLLVGDSELREAALLALERIEGTPASGAQAVAAPVPGRRFRGAPWSVAAPLAILADPGASAPDRDLAFHELCARTKLHVPFDPSWPVERQRGAVAGWAAVLEASAKRFPTGTWIWRGAVVPPPRKVGR